MFPSFPCSPYSPSFSMRDCRNPQFVEPWWNNVQCTMYNANTKLTSFMKSLITSRIYVSINFYCKLPKKGQKVKCLITHWINVTFNWRIRISKGLFISSASSPTLYRYKWKWVKVFHRLLSALMWLWLPNLSKWHLFWPIGSIINKYNRQWAFYQPPPFGIFVMSFILRRITIIQLECVFLQSTKESSLTR